MLVLSCGDEHLIRMGNMGIKAGPLGYVILEEGTIAHTRYAGVPKNSSAPNAATLFITYLHTPEGQKALWKYAGFDLPSYPESNTKKQIEKIRAVGGKVKVNSPQWLSSLQGFRETQKELETILQEAK